MIHTVSEYYKDFYGCTASVVHNSNGAVLTIRTPSGQLIKKQKYATRRGAMIGMGKCSDGWRFVSMDSKGKLSIRI